MLVTVLCIVFALVGWVSGRYVGRARDCSVIHWKKLPLGSYKLVHYAQKAGVMIVQNADLKRGEEIFEFFVIFALQGPDAECLPCFGVEGCVKKRIVDCY
jgi:hypothetical protein